MSAGRNEPCPCGSGKKYKHCHGAPAGEGQAAAAPATAPLFAQAQTHLTASRYPEAEAFYRKILGINPEHADARHYLGMAMCFRGDTEAGLTHIRASLQLRPGDAVYHNNLALWLEAAGYLAEAEQGFRRAVELAPGYREARLSLAKLQLRRRYFYQARIHLRELVRTGPEDLESRMYLADACQGLGEFAAMQQEYRELLARSPQDAALRLRFAEQLALLGLDDEVLAQCEAVLAFDPSNIEAMKTRAYVEERRGRLDEAERWVQAARTRAPRDGTLQRLAARLRRRRGDLPEALACLDAVDVATLPAFDRARHWLERGAVLDKLGRYEEAFAAFRRGKQALRAHLEAAGELAAGEDDRMQREFNALGRFFTRERVAALERCAPPAEGPTPLFIVGFPRSGTTLVEQMLSMHPAIRAGGELIALPVVEASIAVHLGSTRPYPECLADVLEPGKAGVLRGLRDAYLALAREAGAIPPDTKRFTDKTPLNASRLGLIHLLFPHAPVVHVIRHPLDVVLSVFQNEIFQAYALSPEAIATHYRRVAELAERTAGLLGRRYARIRYEDLIRDPETELRRLLEFIGEPWDARCLEFHASGRIARTVSYAQVAQPLYRSSAERWRHYRTQLAPVIPILAPLMDRFGYRWD
jgi:tetratricopeptide (TPR) repeat protein